MQDFGNALSKRMMELTTARWLSQSLTFAAELGLADLLKDGPQSAEELSARTQTHAGSLYRLLRALAGEGVFEEMEGRRFRLTPLGETLRSDVPGSSRPLALFLGRPWNMRPWEQGMLSLRTGRPAIEHVYGQDVWRYLLSNPGEYEEFSAAMTGAARMMHAAALEAYDFSGIGKLVDVGGGHGWLLGSILRKHPSMRGVLFDRPDVVAGARDNLEQMGVLERCELSGGDFLVSVPGGDACVISHVLHNWGDESARIILGNCRRGLRPGDKLIVLDAVIRADNRPSLGKLMDMQMLILFDGYERTEDEFASLYEDAGFKLTRVVPTRSSTSVIEGVAV